MRHSMLNNIRTGTLDRKSEKSRDTIDFPNHTFAKKHGFSATAPEPPGEYFCNPDTLTGFRWRFFFGQNRVDAIFPELDPSLFMNHLVWTFFEHFCL